jgi:hypothetical protein
MHRLSTRKGVNPPFRERTPPFAHLGTWMAALTGGILERLMLARRLAEPEPDL